MRKLWAYGDSNTEDYNPLRGEWAKNYIEWKGYKPKIYAQIIADHYGCELQNFGMGGTNNYYIFQKFCETIHLIEDNDIIILQWSELTRFRLAGNDEWVDFYFRNIDNKNKLGRIDNISISTIQEILLNRLNKIYKEELDAWENIINFVLRNKKYVIWSPFTYTEGYGKWGASMGTISQETNRIIDDPHLNEMGQIKLANILMDKIEYNKKNII